MLHDKIQKSVFFLNLTVLLPERFTAGLPSAYTFGTHLRDSPESHPDTVSLLSEPLRVLLLRWAFASFLHPSFGTICNNEIYYSIVFSFVNPFLLYFITPLKQFSLPCHFIESKCRIGQRMVLMQTRSRSVKNATVLNSKSNCVCFSLSAGVFQRSD